MAKKVNQAPKPPVNGSLEYNRSGINQTAVPPVKGAMTYKNPDAKEIKQWGGTLATRTASTLASKLGGLLGKLRGAGSASAHKRMNQASVRTSDKLSNSNPSGTK